MTHLKKQNKKIRIWDLPTRIYHWLQLLLVFLALGSGFFAPEWLLSYHVFIGYAILALLMFRIILGFFGSEFSRFSSFIFSPKTLIAHIGAIKKNKPLHFFGHNPLGALMVFGLIATLFGIVLSGLINLGGVENQGAFAGFINYANGDIAGKVHLFLAFTLLGMIGLHIFGVMFESKVSNSSLTKSMINGDKPLLENTPAPKMRSLGFMPVIVSFTIVTAALIGGNILMGNVPASGYIKTVASVDYQAECGDCHIVYSPSLLPQKSWLLLMGDLSNHFGEDASLDDDTQTVITSYLARYSAEKWDSEASNNLSTINVENPTQITATPYWKLRHSEIDKTIFKTKPVRSAANCEACHSDAKTGRFDDENIKIPNPKK